MKKIWTHKDIDAPAPVVWRVLTDLDAWPQWGPSVRAAWLDGPAFEPGATGRVQTIAGAELPFEITGFAAGHRWAWNVAGIGATDHTVVSLGPERSRVGFGVPWPAAPYLAVCRIALGRIDELARARKVDA